MEQIVTYVQELCRSPRSRAALRRARSTTTEHYAYAYLAPWWQNSDWKRQPLCSFAGLVASFPDIIQDDSVPVGAMAAGLVLSNPHMKNGVERKLIVAQSAGLYQLTTLLRSLLSAGDHSKTRLDLNDLYWLLLMADNPDKKKRQRSRRKLLEQFYQRLESKPIPR
jgi:CRISPR type I-E-associated protein CasB/Cse2